MPFAQADGYQIHYRIYGQGAPILCPGGWAIITGEHHKRLPERLREEFTTIVFDHRGLGQSTDNGQPFTTADFAKDAARVIEASGFGHAHVYGHGGLGACLSQHLAAQRPELVDGLALISGWAGPDRHKQAQHRMGQLMFELGGLSAYRQYGAINIHLPEYYNEHEAEILSKTGSWGEFEDTDPEPLRKIQKATALHDARAVLPSIKSPTLVVQGERDIIDPPRLGEELVRLIPNARLEILPNAPHSIRSEPKAFKLLGDLAADFFHSVGAKRPESLGA